LVDDSAALWKTACKGDFFLGSSKVKRRTSQITMDGASEWLVDDKLILLMFLLISG